MKKATHTLQTAVIVIFLFSTMSAYAQTPDSAGYYFQKGVEEKTARRFLQASVCFEKAISFNTAYTEAMFENGYANLEMRRTDKAIACFEKVIETSPDNIVAAAQLMELYYNYRLFAKAKQMAGKCGQSLNALKIKGMCSYQTEDYDAAIKELVAYLSSSPADAIAIYTLSQCYYNNGDIKNAIANCNKDIFLNSENNRWHYELGLMYYNNNDYTNAQH